MLKSLLVHVPSERLVRPVVDGAVSLALARGAHLDAVSIGYETSSVGMAFEAGGAAAAVFDIEYERAAERAQAALAVFEAEALNAGITYTLEALTSTPFEAVASLTALARLHDLTVVLQPDPDSDTFDNIISVEILFQAGGPVLFVPYTHKSAIDPKHIGIAWDGSRLAARAVRDAAPFLARAHAVTIIDVNEEDQAPANATAVGLAAQLARHGLAAHIERTMAGRADIQPTILSIAADLGLDLIVMGAYGHSRLRERILGGVTRAMLDSMTVPTLMSH
jgi:Universal stress protein UspA and related nucleotide-binding proteins